MTEPCAASKGDETEKMTCPICYEPPTCSVGAVSCNMCKNAVCFECDTMLTQAGHTRCPMCRAPRPWGHVRDRVPC